MAGVLSRAWWGRFALREERRLAPLLPPGREGYASRFGSAAATLSSLPRTWRARVRPSHEQATVLMLLSFFGVVYFVLSQFYAGRLLIYPFAIASTVFHEFGHALATLATGGRVRSISVALDESGLTRHVGGWRCAVLPAGYVGSTAAGALLVFAAFGARAARIAAGAVLCVLAATAYFAADVVTLAAVVALSAMLLYAVLRSGGQYCRHAVAALGAVCSLHGLVCILASTVFDYVPESDAARFAAECSFLVPAFVYGLLWLAVSAALVLLSVLSALVLLK